MTLRTRKRGIVLIIALAMVIPIAGNGQLAVLETPETVEPGQFSAGLGFAKYTTIYNPAIFVRAGIIPGLQFGITVTSAATKGAPLKGFITPQTVEFDGKINLIENYLSTGIGFNLGVGPIRGNYSFEGSIYIGYPGKVFHVYGALRYWRLHFEPPGVTIPDSWGLFTGSAGLRLKPLDWLAIYGEVGFMYVEASDIFPQTSSYLTTGAGVEFELPFKLW